MPPSEALINLPELGDVIVKSLKLTEYLDFVASRSGGEISGMTDTEFIIFLMTRVVVTKKGEPVFDSPEDWDQYLGGHINASSDLFETVRRVTGLQQEDDVEKK